MVTEVAEHDARLVPGVEFLFETYGGKFGQAKLLDVLPWSNHPHKVEYIRPMLGKIIEQFALSEFARVLLLPTPMKKEMQ